MTQTPNTSSNPQQPPETTGARIERGVEMAAACAKATIRIAFWALATVVVLVLALGLGYLTIRVAWWFLKLSFGALGI